MSDSNSFSSLLDLVDNHLSKCSLKTSDMLGATNSMPRILLNGGNLDKSLQSPAEVVPLPAFNISESPISSILAEQVSNMLKVKAKKKQETEELANMAKDADAADNGYIIDLEKAIILLQPEPVSEEFVLMDEYEVKTKVHCYNLPCMTDISYILSQKVKRSKCSPFGKVLTTRLRPVACPYLHEKIVTTVKRFDFSTRSPYDCIADKMRMPTTYTLPSHVKFDELSVNPLKTPIKIEEGCWGHIISMLQAND